MGNKLKGIMLASIMGIGLFGATAFTSHTSASSLETQIVTIEQAKVVNNEIAEPNRIAGVARALQKAWVYGTESVKYYAKEVADSFFSNSGLASVSEADLANDAEIIFNK